MNIEIQTIAPEKQRYATLGDWFHVKLCYQHPGDEPDARTVIRVSELGDERYEFLIAFHELVEMMLCKQRGISAEEVDKFDRSWQGDGEPGDDPASPYFREHQFAFMLERIMAHELEVNWVEYNRTCDENMQWTTSQS